MRLLTGEREDPADVLLAVLARVPAGDRDRSLLRVEEAEEEVGDGRLAGAARPDQRHAAARVEAEVEPLEHRGLVGRVARGHSLERDDGCGQAARAGGASGSRTVGSRSVSSSTRRPAASVAESSRAATGSGVDRLEGRERQERQRGHENAIERAGVVSRDRDGEHAGDRQPGDEDAEPVGEARHERVTTAKARELRVGLADARERRALAAVHDELRGATQRLRRAAR